MKKFLALTLFCYGLLTSFSVLAQSCNENLLQNSDFENGLASWGGSGEVTQHNSWASDHLQICTSGNRVYQSVPAKANTEYTLQFQAREGFVNQGLVAIKFMNSSWIPIQEDWIELTEVDWQGYEQSVTSPANTAWVEIGIFKASGNQSCIMADRFCLQEGTTGGGLPDLVPVVAINQATASNGENIDLSIQIKNSGSGAGYAGAYTAYLSDDNQFSSDDRLLFSLSPTPYYLFPNESTDVRNESYRIPLSNTFNGTKYIFVQIDRLENVEESDELNNISAGFPIQISTGTGPVNCTNTLGTGDILCSQSAGDNLELYTLEQGNLQQYILDAEGTVLQSQPMGAFVRDSVLIQNNQVIKKLVDGTNAYTKDISQTIQNYFTRIDAAVELADGNFVIAGFDLSIGTPPIRSSNKFILVKADANLNLIKADTINNNRQYNPYYDYSKERVWAMYPKANNELDVLIAFTYTSLVQVTSLNINRYDANFELLNSQNITSNPSTNFSFVETPCGTYFYNGPTAFYSQKGNFSGSLRAYFDQEDFSNKSRQSQGSGSTDYYGRFDRWTFSAQAPDSLTGVFQFRPQIDPQPPITLTFQDGRSNEFQVKMPFYNYIHASKAGSDDVLLFGYQNNQLFVETPTDCYPLLPFIADLTGTDLTIDDPLNQTAGSTVNYFYTLQNDGTKSVFRNNSNTWLSNDRTLGTEDILIRGFNPPGLSAGESIKRREQIQLPLSLADGRYYIIIELDPNQEIVESDKSNNQLVSTEQLIIGSTTASCSGNLIPDTAFDPQICVSGNNSTISRRTNIASSPNQDYQFSARASTNNGSSGFLQIKFLSNSWQVLDQQFFFANGNSSIYNDNFTTPAQTAWIEVSMAKTGTGCLNVSEWCLTQGGVDPCDPDNSGPTFSNCPEDILIQVSYNDNEVPISWTPPTATDACDPSVSLSSTHQPGDLFIAGQTTVVTYTATDDANNQTTCSFNVLISQEGPIFPDLNLSNLMVNSSNAQQGEVVNFTFDHSNIGIENVIGNYNIKSYLSTDQLLSSDDVQDGIIPTGNLSAGTTVYDIGGALTVPNNLPDGNYYLILVADADEQIAEQDETNNTIVSANSIQIGNSNLADLILENFLVDQSNVVVGEVLNFSFDLKNIGQQAASGNYTIKSWISTDDVLDASDYQDGIIPTGNLGAGVSVYQVPGALTIPDLEPGQYNIILKVDADDAIAENDESNNVIVAPGQISILAPPTGNCANEIGIGTFVCSEQTPRGLQVVFNETYQLQQEVLLDTDGTILSSSNRAISNEAPYYTFTETTLTKFNRYGGTEEYIKNLPPALIGTYDRFIGQKELTNGFLLFAISQDLTELVVIKTNDDLLPLETKVVDDAPLDSRSLYVQDVFELADNRYAFLYVYSLSYTPDAFIKLLTLDENLNAIANQSIINSGSFSIGASLSALPCGGYSLSSSTGEWRRSGSSFSIGKVWGDFGSDGLDFQTQLFEQEYTAFAVGTHSYDWTIKTDDGGIITGRLLQNLPNPTENTITFTKTINGNPIWEKTLTIPEADSIQQIKEINDELVFITAGLPLNYLRESCLDQPTGNQADLELNISADNDNPGQWNNVQFSIQLTNKGSVAADDISVQLPANSDANFRDQLAYVSHQAAAGTNYNAWTGEWSIGSLGPNESLSLSYSLFSKQVSEIPFFGQVSAQTGTDLDSAPNNNTSGLPAEDDESLLILNSSLPAPQRSEASSLAIGEASIYPNPADHYLTVNLRAYEDLPLKLSLVDLNGRVVLEQYSHLAKKANIDLKGIANGQYFLRIVSEKYRPAILSVLVEKGD